MPAHGAGRDRGQRFHHHRLGQFGERLCHRPQVGGQRDGRLCRPHAQIRSTIRGSRTIASLVKRRLGMAVGVVTNTEIEDATPAAMVAHTRRRAAYDQIVEQFFAFKPDVLMGGGSANFLPKGAPGGKRAGRHRLHRASSATPATRSRRPRPSCSAAAKRCRRKLLGLFNTGNMDGALDRKFLKGGTREEISRSARPDRAGRGRARRAVAQAEGLLPDGRVRPDRQIHPRARHGARGLRHHHARQRGEARARLGARRAATTR